MGDLVSLARRQPVSFGVIVLIVAVYVVEIAQSSPNFWIGGQGQLPEIAVWGVVWTPAIGDGEWWRLFTAGFLHAGILHLLLNCYALVVIGGVAEYRFGSWRTALIFLVAMVGGDVAAAAFQPNAATLGASGGVMGLAGAVVLDAWRSGEGLARSQWVIVLIVATLAYGFINSGISNAGHIGGLLLGAAVGFLLGLTRRRGVQRQTAPRRPSTPVNPRQVEFQKRIDEAMRKAAEERAREQRESGQP